LPGPVGKRDAAELFAGETTSNGSAFKAQSKKNAPMEHHKIKQINRMWVLTMIIDQVVEVVDVESKSGEEEATLERVDMVLMTRVCHPCGGIYVSVLFGFH
jgi:hypothetical protein